MIEVKNITKTYGNKKVVDNVSLNIEEGKITSKIKNITQKSKNF